MYKLSLVEGVPESALGDVALPAESAPAPWPTELEAVVWFHRAAPGAAAFLPSAMRGRRAFPLTVGAFIRYFDTPVGPYHEVLGSPVQLGASAAVPFIAVDSIPSIHGGRANWALPKTLAEFAWPAFGNGAFSIAAHGAGWTVSANVRPRPRRLPLGARLHNRQLEPGGRVIGFASRAHGRGRLASVEVAATGATLPRWLLPGRHPAIVVDRASAHVGQARPV